MPERATALPGPRHRRHPVRTRVLDAAVTVGSLVTLSALLVLGATAAGLTLAPATDSGTKVVTFEIAGH